MKERAEVYLPAVAEFPKDLERRDELLNRVRLESYKAGILLVLRPEGLRTVKLQEQLDNLDVYAKREKEARPLITVMHPNLPITGDNRLNLLTNPNFTQDRIEQTILDFVSKIPNELTPSSGRSLSFHLNTLVKPSEWNPKPDYWREKFDDITNRVSDISEYGKRHGVSVAIETTPIPEFGDVPSEGQFLLDDGKTHWCQLGNPWPLLFWRPEINKLRTAGANIAIDFCHSYIAFRAIREISNKEVFASEDLDKLMIFSSDVDSAKLSPSFSDMVLKNTKNNDVWHVNDARGLYVPSDTNKTEKNFEEGVTLFEGEIPSDDLKKMIKLGLRRDIKFVLEINETDFVNSPNTKQSLDTLLTES